MIKLALVGKNIQHSRSPQIYHRLLGDNLEYSLLDYSRAEEIPKASELLLGFDGISITSPYKKHFNEEIEFTDIASKLLAVNCLKKSASKVIGANTDYLAIVEILKRKRNHYGALNVIILGDGVMSAVTQVALGELGISYKVLARKILGPLENLNLSKLFSEEFPEEAQTLVINTCSRDFVFKGEIEKSTHFWDYNYDYLAHQKILGAKLDLYEDGLEMLELQARFALEFWSIAPLMTPMLKP